MSKTKLIGLLLASIALSSAVTAFLVQQTSPCNELLKERKSSDEAVKRFMTPNFDVTKRYGKGF